jgi:hypothetical protein
MQGLLGQPGFGLYVCLSQCSHFLGMFVEVSERGIDLAEREVELIGDVDRGMVPPCDQLVDVEDANASPLDARVPTEDAGRPDDFGHCQYVVRHEV